MQIVDNNLERFNEDASTNEEPKKLKWSSRFEFIVTLLGFSLGLGDIWRVPYLTYRNGGGKLLLRHISGDFISEKLSHNMETACQKRKKVRDL